MSENLRILIAEDHQTVREGLKLILSGEKDMEVIGEAGGGREAIDLAERLRPDVVLMDVSMPELNGLVATAKLRRILPEIRILAVTRHNDAAYLTELLEAGVSGYVLKQSPSRELVNAVRAVARGDCYLDSSLTGKVFGMFVGEKSRMHGDTGGKQLTARESETLRFVALGYSNREIAEKLDVSVKTIEAHKANAMKKLDLTTRKDIVGYAIMKGWMQTN